MAVMNRQCYFTEKDIEPVVYRRKLLKYYIEVQRRNAENYRRWKDRYYLHSSFINEYKKLYQILSGSLK